MDLARVNSSNKGTSLFLAGSPQIAEWLIERGVDVNAKNEFGETALVQALKIQKSRGFEIAKVLLKHAADSTSRGRIRKNSARWSPGGWRDGGAPGGRWGGPHSERQERCGRRGFGDSRCQSRVATKLLARHGVRIGPRDRCACSRLARDSRRQSGESEDAPSPRPGSECTR